jgi:peroxiredoxin
VPPIRRPVFFLAGISVLFALGFPAEARLIKPASRKKAPAFELTDSQGQTVRLADLKGKVVLLDFWATWCGPCQTEIPWFVEFAGRYRERGLVVVGVSMDEGGWDVVRAYMHKMGINYPVVLGNKRTAYLYGDIDGLPVTFLLDREQRVAAIHAGLAKKKTLEEQIEELLVASAAAE